MSEIFVEDRENYIGNLKKGKEGYIESLEKCQKLRPYIRSLKNVRNLRGA